MRINDTHPFGRKPFILCKLAGILGAAVLVTVLTVPGEVCADQEPFSYDHYAALLKTRVNDEGLVDYKGLKAERARLDAYATAIANVDPGEFEKWSDPQKIAFWINAYNGLTLIAIIDHYPIEPSWLKSFRYPENSIRQIPGVWTDLEFTVMGRNMTLDGIEHDTLRADFNEPRIHVALVCAALGCPVLRNEPYTGARLDAQLDDQSKRFVNNPEKLRIDRKDGVVYLSSIFKWFGDDFIKTYGTTEKFADFDDAERAVLNYITQYVSHSDADFLRKGDYSIEYLSYDWTLNDQALKSK
jgi:hypothetical protein